MQIIAVIGAGPAGIAAAIQLRRSGRNVDVYEPGRIGGTLWNAGWVENYPGFPGGIAGRHLARLMEEHLLLYVDSVKDSRIPSIERRNDKFHVDGVEYDGVVVATGTIPRKAGFSGEDELASAGKLLYSMSLEHWHGLMDFCIIGGGEASIDMAINLAQAGKNITIVHRSEPRGIRTLMNQAREETAISWKQGNVKSARLHEEKVVIALEDEELAFDFVLVAVGRERTLPELVGIQTDNLPEGLFIVGDAARGRLGQVSMAVGDGIEAAMAMGRYLGGLEK